uniref:Uncharacterized protein n=1 Tax=Bacillus cereus HuA4-10 TaxID=1053206 RepID=J8DEK4_BACCE|nr:hypothetical protein IGC_04846 [Bacillus cereus HuA4-10]
MIFKTIIMPYINKGEVLKETPPFQRTMNFGAIKNTNLCLGGALKS